MCKGIPLHIKIEGPERGGCGVTKNRYGQNEKNVTPCEMMKMIVRIDIKNKDKNNNTNNLVFYHPYCYGIVLYCIILYYKLR